MIFVRISSSAAVASFVLAQPMNLYPSLVGAVGAVTVLSSFVVTPLLVVLSSYLPPFASNVTNFSSDQIAYTTWCEVIGVSDVNFIEASRLLKSSAFTIVFPSLVLPSSVTQPRKVFPVAVGSSANLSPVPF